MADQDDVRRLALELPETTQHDDGFGFSVRGKSFAWVYWERVAPKKPRIERPDVLAVRVAGEDDKQSLIAADPGVFFTDDHYRGFPAILIRLPAVDDDELRELLVDGWRVQAPRTLVKQFDADQGNG